MYEYSITLKVTSIVDGLTFTAYPIITRTTQTKDRGIVEHATVNRYIRDNWGQLTDVTVARTSIIKVKEVA